MFYNLTGEAVPHLPPLTARPWLLFIMDNIVRFLFITAMSDIHIIKANNALYHLKQGMFREEKGSRFS